MSRPILVAIFAISMCPVLPAQHMTVDRLRGMLAAQKAAHKSDGDMAGKVGGVTLTEQLTAPTLEKLEAELQPGAKTVEALDLQADVSGFLDPPPDELPTQAPPDAAACELMLRRAIEFAAITMHRLRIVRASSALYRVARTRGSGNCAPPSLATAGRYPARSPLSKTQKPIPRRRPAG